MNFVIENDRCVPLFLAKVLKADVMRQLHHHR
jgi:hypothetical protein